MSDKIVFYHSPRTRASGVFFLLEELGADYEMRVLNMKAGENREPAFLAVNPLGKLPTIVADGQVITEQGAVYIYLADRCSEAGLAPAIGDPLRGAYLRWMVFYGSSFEPAVVDKAMKRPPAPVSTSPYGDFDTVISTLFAQLEKGPYMLGERFTALDVLWGMALSWMVGFKLVEPNPAVKAYLERITARPAYQKVVARDAELAAAHEVEAAAKKK